MTPICGPSLNCCHKIGSPSLELTHLDQFQHDHVTVNKARFMKTRGANVGVEQLVRPVQSPALNPTEHLQHKLKGRLHPRPLY